MANLISIEVIAGKILVIRGKRVMLDKDLAILYGVKPIALRQQVKRNQDRFPEDFMFQLTGHEVNVMVSHSVIPSRSSLGGYSPLVFTEQGVAMLSSVLNSKRAVLVNIQIMRAFVKLRNILSDNKQFEIKLRELEDRFNIHDEDISDIFEAIRQLMGIPDARKVIKGFAQK